jgi:hypothetical protein
MILDQYGNAASSSFLRRPSRHANLGGGDRPSESRNLRDLHKIVTKYDRETLQSASRTLYLNSPLMVGASNQIGIYAVGNAWLPTYKGKDKKFGDAAKFWLKDEWYPICNIDGDIADFTSDMFVDSVSIDRDGEVFEYSTQTKNGYPQIQQIPSHRISSGEKDDGIQKTGKYAGYDLYDGIVYFPGTSIPVAYSLCDVDGKHKQFIEKKFILHVFDRYWPEQRRGLPLFWHSLNNLRDIMQSEEWERMNLLSMSSLNYTVENETGGPDMEEPGYVPGDCGNLAVQFLQGGRIMYAKAGAGEKITQHQNFRPGNPWHEFYDMQARQCLVGACLPATLWKPSGQGTAQREDIGKACRFVEDRQSTLEKIAKWRVTKAVAWAMENNRIPQSADWFNWSFTKPSKLTIDDGRSLKEKMALYDKGLINATSILGELSMDLDESIDERTEEAAKVIISIREKNAKYGVEIDPRSVRLLTASEQPQPDESHNGDQSETNNQTS